MFSSRILAALLVSIERMNYKPVRRCAGIMAIADGKTAKIKLTAPWLRPSAHNVNAFRFAVRPVVADYGWGAAVIRGE